MSSKPSLPPFDHVRLARLSDLGRIATVAAAGFFWSPTFQFQRPLYAEHPADTLSSYWLEYRDEIKDPASVVLVVEDSWKPKERDKVYDALRHHAMYVSGADAPVKVVVGVCSIDLEPGSARIGQLQPAGKHFAEVVEPPSGITTLNRDQSTVALDVYSTLTGPAKKKYLMDQMRLSTLAVHPAYWHQGHASRLVGWCTRLADLEAVSVGISATPAGAIVAAKAGFEEVEKVKIDKSDMQQRGLMSDQVSRLGEVSLWIGIRQPSQSSSDVSAATSVSPDSEQQ
ncbi:hypothetical protein K491DRAFT_599177 [Lophiostoma macrostomum CBS 122681]|uniref:N-acetyltransferase domain-containing protein n=1 Tax=Lophiostoma macrostomum CBS 122681 TaxID=1314788 RepID=A0A6A6T619_9PLEO|nr:hypothetical protein K491DRAFT_599177 [Lophiostoma macrostomum CBS 122681]